MRCKQDFPRVDCRSIHLFRVRYSEQQYMVFHNQSRPLRGLELCTSTGNAAGLASVLANLPTRIERIFIADATNAATDVDVDVDVDVEIATCSVNPHC